MRVGLGEGGGVLECKVLLTASSSITDLFCFVLFFAVVLALTVLILGTG